MLYLLIREYSGSPRRLEDQHSSSPGGGQISTQPCLRSERSSPSNTLVTYGLDTHTALCDVFP